MENVKIRRYMACTTLSQNFYSIPTEGDVNYEKETSIDYTLDGLKFLIRKIQGVRVANIILITQRWLTPKGPMAPEKYTMRVRYERQAKLETSPDELFPAIALDDKTLQKYTHTVKHKFNPLLSLEVDTELRQRDYEAICNLNSDKEEVNKTRVELICPGISRNQAIVTADIYDPENVRIEVELLAAGEEKVTIPHYLFMYSRI